MLLSRPLYRIKPIVQSRPLLPPSLRQLAQPKSVYNRTLTDKSGTCLPSEIEQHNSRWLQQFYSIRDREWDAAKSTILRCTTNHLAGYKPDENHGFPNWPKSAIDGVWLQWVESKDALERMGVEFIREPFEKFTQMNPRTYNMIGDSVLIDQTSLASIQAAINDNEAWLNAFVWAIDPEYDNTNEFDDVYIGHYKLYLYRVFNDFFHLVKGRPMDQLTEWDLGR
ncbi:uncharacterized protein K452DRAFT_313573 [Aplosporella prunicola CBS 121167]|uniref:Uncharacterized protein n=1 Tax=Aplosporella prunicola CBS 121167 TaxID=1176127 RepID=A0A6A6AXK9_9PEZI|nr:uncharacterized protein K452DRAFT_313573 [Aplosporella prunicola CBS 121167]KAF2135988.1 hypothetical protein K452DRAFT_313573 [Aplosporella prunicola CBS 121167]